jgi:hypothetical protein
LIDKPSVTLSAFTTVLRRSDSDHCTSVAFHRGIVRGDQLRRDPVFYLFFSDGTRPSTGYLRPIRTSQRFEQFAEGVMLGE